MPDRHREKPLSLRLGAEREWVEEHAARTGMPVRQVILTAIREKKERDMSITDEQIKALEQEAGQAGDTDMAGLCQAALGETLTAFDAQTQYRVIGLGGRVEDFADPAGEMAANGIKATRDGDDMLVSGRGLAFLAETFGPDDDGCVENGFLWAGGEEFAITCDDRDRARAECARVIAGAKAMQD